MKRMNVKTRFVKSEKRLTKKCIVYPFTVLALLVGDGAAAGFSIALGTGDKKQANRNIGNGVILLVCVSAVICLVGFLCRTQILGLFGGDPQETVCYGYATDYFRIICAGIPFYMIGQGMNGSIRADGSPRYAMACTLAGAFTNLIFDPVLIIGFNMGADHMERVKETIQHFERFAGSAWRSDGCAGVPPGIYDESGGCGCQDENVNVIDCFQKNARKIYIGIMGDLCHII